MQSVLLPFLQIYTTYIKQQFVRQTRRVNAVQSKFLLELLGHHQQTELGQRFQVGNIRSVDQFRTQIPIHPYSFYEPYTERIAKGESNLLNPDPVVYISLTSGSTGKHKLVPVTWRFQKSLRQANLAAIGFCVEALQSEHNWTAAGQKLEFGKLLTTNSLRLQGKTEAGIPYGPVTVGSLRMGQFFYSQTFSQPYDALLIGDSLARHYVCLLFTLKDRQLRCMAANFPMLVLRTCHYLAQYAEDLIQDIRQGTIASWLVLEPDLRQRLERQWRADPHRADELQTLLQEHGQLTPKLAWPGLSYIGTARGGTSDFYFQNFPKFFGQTPVFGGVYGSAEATFGIYPDLNTDGSILAISSGFYEFVPEDQWDTEHPKTLLPTEVNVGHFYRILVTSYSGFYRYDIGDVVQVVGFYQEAPLIVFRYRQGGLLSSTTEKTTEDHVTQVMKHLQAEFQVHLDDFCVTLSDQDVPAAYCVNIELAEGQHLPQPDSFLIRFDECLKAVNNPYGTVRIDQVPPPRLRVLAPGSFGTVRQRQIEKGMSDSQLKFPHISEDRQFLVGLTVRQEVRMEA
ncbi:MAG: GH3 auxin-responsive promoter family protein [Thermosynechococcaceae cyanobacterium]